MKYLRKMHDSVKKKQKTTDLKDLKLKSKTKWKDKIYSKVNL